MKTITATILIIAGILSSGCAKKPTVSTKEMLETVKEQVYLEHPIQKELGEENFSFLINRAKSGIQLIYDYPDNVSDEERKKLIEEYYHPDSIQPVYERIGQTLSAYGKSRVSIDKVQDVKKGFFREMESYKVYFKTRVRFREKEESIVFEVILVETPENHLLVYWAEPAK